VVLAIDLMTGGDLHEYLAKRGDTCDKMALSEAEARKVFAQLLAGVNYIHQQRIVHRDMKLENILYVSPKPFLLYS
jgi:serine/threonine protein kinase